MQYYINGKPILVSENSTKENPYTWLGTGRTWEESELKFFYSQVEKIENPTILDIGAQSGLYTLYAKHRPDATFFSFEPFKKNYDLLVENLELNNITNVMPFNLALSNKKETKEIKVPEHLGLITLGDNPIRFKEYTTNTIQTDTIDNLFLHKKINFIKCDTEGWEYFVLCGGLQTIQKFKPAIFIEYYEPNMTQCNVKKEMVDQFFVDNNYKLEWSGHEERYYVPFF